MACLLPFAMVANETLVQIAQNSPGVGAGVVILAQIGVSWWIWSVWTWRFALRTPFRGRASASLLGEFQEYGYTKETFKAVGAVKCGLAAVVGPVTIAYPNPALVYISAGGLLALMAVAIISHVRVGDAPIKSLPAGIMAALNAFILLGEKDGCVLVAPATGYAPNFVYSFLELIATQEARLVIALALTVVIFIMWIKAYQSGVYRIVDDEAPPSFWKKLETTFKVAV